MLILHKGSAQSETNEQVIDLPVDKNYITHKASGRDVLTMIIPKSVMEIPEAQGATGIDPIAIKPQFIIDNEDTIITENNQYRVKNIDKYDATEYTVDAEVDLSDFREAYYESYSYNVTLAGLIYQLTGGTWTTYYYTSGIDDSKNLCNTDYTPYEHINGLELIENACQLWGVRPIYDAKGKKIYFMDPNRLEFVGDNADFINIEGSDMTLTGYTRNSTEIYNRIYAYGKKDETTGQYMTFASINGGKAYLDDKRFLKDKIVPYVWIDERYTVKQNLKDAAAAKLATLSAPVANYQLEMRNMPYTPIIFQPIKALVSINKVPVLLRVVEWTEYPGNTNLNTAILSNVIPD